MQGNPAGKRPRVFQPRGCVDCPASFTPTSGMQTRCPDCQAIRDAEVARECHDRKMARRRTVRAEARKNAPVCSVDGCEARLRRSNIIGRCQEHRYIGADMGTCGQEGCENRLRRDNRIGYCEDHKYRTAREPERFCVAEDCGRQLRADNESGYCPGHAYLSDGTRESRERYYARLRQETRDRPDTRAVCSVGDCENRLRSDNIIGRCSEHYYLPVEMPVCSFEDCENRLTALNMTGRCMGHRAKYWAAATCAAEGCEQILYEDNATGYCYKHRSMAPENREFQRTYYQSRKAEFQQYARDWRLANGDDHRAAVRAWNAANREARQAMHARRRTRAQVNMTDEDRRRSVARRKEIKGDRCFYCGDPGTSDTDHYFPLAKGGTDHWWNLVRACDPCNSCKNATCGTAFMLRTGWWNPPPLPPLILAAA